MPHPHAMERTASASPKTGPRLSTYSGSQFRSSTCSLISIGCPSFSRYMLSSDARTATSLAPPAAQTVTHSLQPRRRILLYGLTSSTISSKGFLFATIMISPSSITGASVAPSTSKLVEPPPHKKEEAQIQTFSPFLFFTLLLLSPSSPD